MAETQRREEWAALVDAHSGAAWAMVRKLCRHEQDAEDAFQETATRAWKHWPGVGAIGNPRAWLMTIAYRVCLDQRGGAKACEMLSDAADVREVGPADAAASQEEAVRVRAAITDLPAEVRDVFVLHYTGGLSIRDAAAAMGIKVGTAKSRLSAGLNQLRVALTRSKASSVRE